MPQPPCQEDLPANDFQALRESIYPASARDLRAPNALDVETGERLTALRRLPSMAKEQVATASAGLSLSRAVWGDGWYLLGVRNSRSMARLRADCTISHRAAALG